MKKLITKVALGALLVTSGSYAANLAGCVGCHGADFEKEAMGKSKVVKDMTKDEIIKALKGYKDGSYGGAMKTLMKGQVASLDDAGIEAVAAAIKGAKTKATAPKSKEETPATEKKASHFDLNANASDKKRIDTEELSHKKTVTEEELGLRKTNLYNEDDAQGNKTDYSRPAPGASTKFERAYRDAPPMIPHSVEGLLPITISNNQCVSCHMPAVAKSMGATPISETHFTNYRPDVSMKGNDVIKEGKIVGKELANSSDILIAKAKKSDKLYAGRFNCSQCHAPQSKTKTDVANTFRPDFGNDTQKAHSNLLNTINEGVK